MTTVRAVEAIPYRLPMRGELHWGQHGALTRAEYVVVKVTLSDGSTGFADAPPRPTIYGETVESIRAAVKWIEPRVLGLEVGRSDPLRPPWDLALAPLAFNFAAKSALDMALADACLAARGLSLESLLGPISQAAVSYILGIGDLDTVLTEAHAAVADGVRVLKVKVGRDLQADLTIVQALRAELGDEVRLYADSNEMLQADTAADHLAKMASLGLLWVEEPLPVRELLARQALRARNVLPIIADDSAFGLDDLRRELAFDTFDILNVKPARSGFAVSAAMVELARQAGKGVMIGSQAGSGLGTRSAAIVASWSGVTHPSELSFFTRLTRDILNTRPIIQDGLLDLRQWAVATVDEAALEDMRLDS